MLFWIRRSFKRQIIFALFMIMSLVSVLTLVKHYYDEKQNLTNILEAQAFQMADRLGITVTNDVRYNNYFELSDNITRIYLNNQKLASTGGALFQVVDISIVDSDKRTIAHSNPKEHPLQLIDPQTKEKEKFFTDSNLDTQLVWNSERTLLHLKRIIRFDSDVVGIMYINVSPASLTKSEDLLLINLLTLVVLLTFVLITFAFLFGKWVDRPLNTIINELDKLGDGNIDLGLLTKRRDEFSILANSIMEADSRISQQNMELLKIQETLESQVEKRTKELHDELVISGKKDKQLLHQSRLAQIGEMISMIAHQWRQPLGAISATSAHLQLKLSLNGADLQEEKGRKEFLNNFSSSLEDIDSFVQNLTVTIDDFRNFYKPNKDRVVTTLKKVIMKTLKVIKSSLDSNKIEIVYDFNDTNMLALYEHELMQVVLNILKNAEDNFQEKEIENKQIKITTKENSICICDNGGGIQESIIDKIFDPYFSTKGEKNGTGLGLYMSKMIIEEHHDGKLKVKNQNRGVCFIIEVFT